MDYTIDDYIYYNHKVGVDGLLVTGLPGSGKSNMLNGIVGLCLKERGENFVIPIDPSCEFLNVMPYAQKTIIILPDIQEKKEKGFYFLDFKHEKNVIYVDYETLKISDYLDNNSRGVVIAIYDNHFRGPLLHKRCELWVNITQQLVDRTFLVNHTTGLLFHEAGIYFPEMPIGEHWKGVQGFAELFVDFRKRHIRGIFISQGDKEIKHTIRGKCFWRIYKKGYVSKIGNPEPIFNTVYKLRIDQYHFYFSGGYTMYNEFDETPEYNLDVRIIPTLFPKDEKKSINGSRNKAIKKLSERGWEQEPLSELFDLSQQRISQIINA